MSFYKYSFCNVKFHYFDKIIFTYTIKKCDTFTKVSHETNLRRGKTSEKNHIKKNYLALSIYSPLRVSTRILSPVLMKRGTRTVAPVSTVAGFRVLVAVSPFNPGSV